MPTTPVPLRSPHVRLRPGVRVVARGRDRWQVGSVDGLARVLPQQGAADRVVRALKGVGEVPDDPQARQVLTELAGAGLVETRQDTDERGRRRCAARVRVLGTLGCDPAPLLGRAGVRAVRRPPADLVLRLCVGELPRSETDQWVRAQLPHLVVRAMDGVVVLGPFVVPGRTACLRCLDSHRHDDDFEHPAVVERYVRATAAPRADGAPEPVDLALATLATAWAVRDALSFVEGGSPSTWSSTVTLGHALAEVTAVSWLRHPACGCAWPEDSGTMEA